MSAEVSVGLMLVNRGPVMGLITAGELLDMATEAEETGWDSIWVGDSLLAKPRLDSITLLSAVAARTRRVRLGPACMASTPLRHPLVMALQWATLDVISGGRTVFVACQGGGPGDGDFVRELQAMDIDRGTRMRRVEEAIEVLRLAWSGEQFSYNGDYHTFAEVTVLPSPVQLRVPIWIAANPDLRRPNHVATAYRRVATYADGWQTTHTTPENVARSWQLIQEHAAERGRVLPPDFEVCVCSNICVANDQGAALDEARRFLNAHSMTSYSQEFLASWVAAGTPEDCVAHLQRFIAAGASSILLRISSWDQSGQLARITRDVVPALTANRRIR